MTIKHCMDWHRNVSKMYTTGNTTMIIYLYYHLYKQKKNQRAWSSITITDAHLGLCPVAVHHWRTKLHLWSNFAYVMNVCHWASKVNFLSFSASWKLEVWRFIQPPLHSQPINDQDLVHQQVVCAPRSINENYRKTHSHITKAVCLTLVCMNLKIPRCYSEICSNVNILLPKICVFMFGC